MNLNKFLPQAVCAIFLLSPSATFSDEVREGLIFADQIQYEIFYDYVYQVNFTEFLLSDCTGDRSIAAKYYLGIRLSETYQEILLEVDSLDDVFTGHSLTGRLWGELVRGVRRGNHRADPVDPMAFAQQVAHECFDEYEAERGFLCDYIWWEEYASLGHTTSELVSDAKSRYAGTEKLEKFLEEISSFQRNYQRVLEKSPLTAN